MRCSSTEAGSFSLSMLYSTAAGVLFVMLFYNLTSYLGATSAVRQAARVAARCLTPTDPECIQVQHQNGADIEREWFGYPNESENVSVFVPMVEYEASMLRRGWGVEYETVELQKGDHEALLTTYRVPQQQYRLHLNPAFLANGFSDAEYQPAYYQPTAPFPGQDRDTSLSPETWLAGQGTTFRPALSEKGLTIQPGSQREFSTGFISVPVLPGVEEGLHCFNPDDTPCENASAAGGTADTESWKTHAYIAIKTFARVQAQQARTQVRWNGLFIDIVGPDQAIETLCLGGSDWSESIGRQEAGHNLWLRGPAGATGGDNRNAVCPPRNGKTGNIHDEIAVPRGGAFQVRAALEVQSGQAPATVDVDVLYHLNEYRLVEGDVIQCERYRFTRANTADSCPSLKACRSDDDDSLLDERKYRLVSCKRTFEKELPICEATEKSLPVEGELYTAPAAFAACSVNRPLELADFEAPEGRAICGIELLGTTEPATVLAAPPSCEQFKSTEALSCGVETIVGRTPELTSCPSASSRIKQLQASISALNAGQPKSAPKFGTSPELKWEKPKQTTWEAHWLPEDENGKQIPLNGTSARNVTRSFFLDEPHLAKKNESVSARPEINLAQEVKANAPDIRGNWQSYAARIKQHARPTLLEERVAINQGFPFTDAVPELYWGQVDSSKGWDFNRDCVQDSYCSTSLSFESLEGMLRHYAAGQIAEAADPEYEFSYTETFRGLQHLAAKSRTEAAALKLPECTPTRTMCTGGPEQTLTPVSLGVYKEAPQSCRDETYVGCFSRPVGTDIREAELLEVFDERKAAELGLAELRRIFPFAVTDTSCGESDSACAAIDVELDNEGRALVQVQYNMPVVFPLDLMLGREVIPVRYSKEEVLERRFVGWKKGKEEAS